MESKEIRRYAHLMEELDLQFLEVTENGSTVKLSRAMRPANTAPAAPAEAQRVPVRDTSVPVIADDKDIYTVTSPMVGTFFSAAGEEARPYVSVGSRVKKGDVVCIIEAMKLMNEITADCGGVVEEVCLKDRDLVDYGTPLFKIRRG